MNTRTTSQQPASYDGQEHEIELWLTSKLNADWSSERIANQLTPEILGNCVSQYERLRYMETPIKLRLLSSCLSLKKKSLADMGPLFQPLFDKSMSDEEEDEWVRVISDILSVYPTNNCMKPNISVKDADKEDSLANLFQDTLERFKDGTLVI
jgi:hypothetical protein